MKKIVFQISLILLIMIGSMSVLITNSNAAVLAKIEVASSVKVENEFTVKVLPTDSNTRAIQAKVTVKWSDGTTESKGVASVNEVSKEAVATFTAKKAGNATITVSEVIRTVGREEITDSGNLTTTINVIGETNNQDSSGTTNNNGGSQTSTPPASSTGTTNNNNNASTSTGNNNQTSNDSQAKYTNVNETVVITDSDVNFRKEASTKSGSYGLLQAGTKLTRTAIGDNGWSKVTYNGKNGYVYSQYLKKESDSSTANQDVTFKDVNEKMYASQNCNLRKSWSTDSDKVGYLNEGQEVTRTGVADNGWSRINYNGQVVYVATRLLTSTKPDEDENQNEVTNEVMNEVTNETTNELTEEQKLAEIQEEVGVLPEVGNNIANNLYFIITVIAIIIVSAGLYFHIKKSE